MEMRDMLREAEEALPHLLADESRWNDVDVNYHPPRVERLWMPFNDGRIFLHDIHPCEPEDALLHPHPWPSGMLLLDGEYVMGYGKSVSGEKPERVEQRIVRAGEIYVMEDPNEWHYVAPVREAVKSVMVIGAPWEKQSKHPPSIRGLSHIVDERRHTLIEAFRRFFPPT